MNNYRLSETIGRKRINLQTHISLEEGLEELKRISKIHDNAEIKTHSKGFSIHYRDFFYDLELMPFLVSPSPLEGNQDFPTLKRFNTKEAIKEIHERLPNQYLYMDLGDLAESRYVEVKPQHL